ncbi:Na+/H+ antiporter NhaC [Blastococcus xanthinilyticus]|uniref:Transporter (NhaC family) n=1 Tax=Blastococcus xanthinilyticus TaxID=1564164 RepID=A0A5S5CP75_9ACTN|nr:Na+/H+ antiporter NhaC [Blastococcus xanthinilyticus]TYP81162.1 transporter (NhaC family) [Blastococcus xanthinilyticus]
MGESSALTPRRPSLVDVVVPLAALAVLIAGCLLLFGLDALDGPLQVALVMCAAIAALIALKNGHRWEEVQSAGQEAIASVTSAMFILLAVGALIGTWNLSGTIPTLVYYGIQVLSPSWFYAATAIICGIVALSIGSSWTTAATLGVGLVGIASLLDISVAITAGAVISGAYLGDKTSPLSETTILTAQMVGVDPREHIKRQVWTSAPAFLIALVVFVVLGFVTDADVQDAAATDTELADLDQLFWISPVNLLPLLLLIVLSVRKAPASLSLLGSALFAGVLAAFTQPQVVADFVAGEGNVVVESIKATWQTMATGFTADTGLADVDRLVSRGGMESMLLTLWLIFGAVTFGVLLEKFGLIARLIDPMIATAKSTGRLFATVFACAFGLNVVAGDQYIALVLPARIFRVEFARRGLAPTNLSRLAADSGTVTSPLVPWNSCGAFMAATLGVSTLLYAPWAIFCYASPALSVLYGVTGFKIEKVEPTALDQPTREMS